MTWDLDWDHEVDVVCTDAGIAGLAGAISAIDEGAKALVARAPAARAAVAEGSHPGWFTYDSGDNETASYLAELAGDLDVGALPQLDDDLPLRSAPQTIHPRGRRSPPFVGSQLRDWAARCIPSPSGYLYTRVTDWTGAAMESADGEAIVVTEIGSLSTGPDDLGGSALEWLNAEAHMRGVDIHPVLGFERLVFEDGDVAGAVFTTRDGPLAIRARHGVLFCRAGSPACRVPRLPVESALRVALVGKAASRFGRVELLMPEPVTD